MTMRLVSKLCFIGEVRLAGLLGELGLRRGEIESFGATLTYIVALARGAMLQNLRPHFVDSP